jgi:exopolysaccharide biosynthesis protein
MAKQKIIFNWQAKFLIAIMALILFAIFFLYGPYAGFRNFLVTTAMHTSEHKYIAEIFYSQGNIDEIMSENRVIEPAESTQIINTDNSKHDNNIELININNKSYSGYLIKIHDPSRVSVAAAGYDKGLLLEEIASRNNAVAAINASGYLRIEDPGIPTGLLIANSKKLFDNGEVNYSVIGFDNKNNLILGKYNKNEIDALNLRDAVDFGPFLIVNGTKSEILGNGGGYAPRSAIGQTKDGTVLFLVLDGRTLDNLGATMQDVQDIMVENGAVNAANLDGGSSVSMLYQGRLVNNLTASPKHRILPCCFIVK